MFFWGKKSKEDESAAFTSQLSILKVKEQVEKQLEILRKVGILEVLGDGKTLGILGIDN